MSRSEERVESVPLMKMRHLMVHRRQVAEKKTASSVNEALYDGLVTFTLDRQESDAGKPQQILKRRGDFEREAADSASGDGDDWNRGRRRSDRKHLHRIRLGPTLTTSLSFNEPRNVAPLPEKLMADDATGKFAYISLDGRLINAELATSATSIGGTLGREEAQAWEDFVPMQRILIVAVSAAAAAAAKHRNREEIDRLLKTVEKRENELFSLRQELGELCKQSNPNPLPIPGSASPTTPVQEQPLRDNFIGDNVRVNLNLQEAWSSSKPRAVSERRGQGECDESSPCRSDSFSSSAPPAKEGAKWYVNPMVETSDDFYNISTPERTNAMFSVCNPAVQGSFEWEVLRSSFGSRESMDPSPGHVNSTQMTTVCDSSYQTRPQEVVDDGALHKEHVAMRGICAAIILDLRKRMLSVLDKEASMVMAALESSVSDAKSQLTAMHLAVASCWNASMLQALAALSLSPSEFDCWRPDEAQGEASVWNDASKIEESIVAWRQYLEKNDVPCERRSPSKFNGSDSTLSLSGAGEWLAPFAYSGQNENRRIEELACSPDSQLLGAESDKATAQVKGYEDVAELVKQLESKEVEVADLKKTQEALLEAKNKEIEELKEDFKRRDAELDKRLAAVEITKAESADRLAMLEEICREKDSALSNMKQDIQALESKVQKSRAYQSPVTQRGRRYSTSSTPSSGTGNGTSQKQRFSDRHAPSSDPIHEYIDRFKKKEVPSNKGPFRNVPYINTQRHEELTDDGRSEHGYDQETSHDYSSPPGSTIGDDCSVTSLAFSETEVESRFGSEYCSSGDDSRYRTHNSQDRIPGTKASSSHTRTLHKQKSASSDLRRAITSTTSSGRSLTRTQSNKNFTSASGEKSSTKPLQRTYSGEMKKVVKDPNSPRTSLGTSNLKGLGSVAANHRRASSLDMNFKPNVCVTALETSGLSVGMSDSGSPNSQDSSAVKRKRWV